MPGAPHSAAKPPSRVDSAVSCPPALATAAGTSVASAPARVQEEWKGSVRRGRLSLGRNTGRRRRRSLLFRRLGLQALDLRLAALLDVSRAFLHLSARLLLPLGLRLLLPLLHLPTGLGLPLYLTGRRARAALLAGHLHRDLVVDVRDPLGPRQFLGMLLLRRVVHGSCQRHRAIADRGVHRSNSPAFDPAEAACRSSSPASYPARWQGWPPRQGLPAWRWPRHRRPSSPIAQAAFDTYFPAPFMISSSLRFEGQRFNSRA